MKKGILTISLDFELYWGVRDKRTIEQYKDNLDGVEKAITTMLDLFSKYNIHTTWATVGFLFYDNQNELEQNIPEVMPTYLNQSLNPYTYIKNTKLEEQYHFALDLIQKIVENNTQEIATHTLSHYYCLESGQTLEQFKCDLKSAIDLISTKTNKETYSLVFPRNQWNESYLEALKELNIKSYRGNENHWIYSAQNGDDETLLKRAFRLLDSYINITGHHTYNLDTCVKTNPANIPASRFLRPYSKKLEILDKLKIRRIKKSMTYAAKNNEIFHLWWHPHNFGTNLEKNILMLEEILIHYKVLENKYGMVSRNMKEIVLEN